ncbi:MAG TPA: murein L,D-transpeptidase catalytic domain family protein [Chitinophagaceae bacterium]|jgi:hypothetical protein|nr:murein L,D-transpeptidase catalytic domain family protein [Chitinophagaceae bacterium]
MKNRAAGATAIALFLCIISCTALEKNKTDEPYPPRNEKKETYSVVSKTTPTYVTKNRVNEINVYAHQKGFSTKYCFLIDMSLPSGRNRFFVYDLEKNFVVYSGLVAHGSCNEKFLSQAKFSNAPSSGCSSLGKYRVGAFYRGSYGKSFKLHGLEYSNSNAYKRAVVLHGFSCVPNEEIYPRALCNSLGCTMVSNSFFDKLSRIIEQSQKPVLLWVYQ